MSYKRHAEDFRDVAARFLQHLTAYQEAGEVKQRELAAGLNLIAEDLRDRSSFHERLQGWKVFALTHPTIASSTIALSDLFSEVYDAQVRDINEKKRSWQNSDTVTVHAPLGRIDGLAE